MSMVSDGRGVIRRRAWITLLLTLTALVALYAAAWTAHLRFDWTEDRVYTLSDSTKTILAQLKDPVQIRAYITSGLPQPYGALRRFITDMLASYHDASPQVSYEVIDPGSDPNVAASLAAMGIPRVQVQAVEDDQAQIKQGYMAIVVEYLDKKEIIPVVQSEAGFEYNLTRKIKRVTGSGQLKIGVVDAFGSSTLTTMQRLQQLAGDDYQLRSVNPDKEPLPADLRGLVIAGLNKPPSDLFRYRVEQFRLRGNGVLVLAGNALPQLQRGFQVQAVDPYTNDWLREDLGVVVRPGLVIDRDASRVMVNQRQGMFMFRSAVDYPFMPAIHDLNQQAIATQGLKQVSLPFVSPLACVEENDCTVLMRTSGDSAVQNGPPFDVDPLRSIASRLAGVQRAPQVVAVSKQGALHGHRKAPEKGLSDDERKQPPRTEAASQRLMVIGAPALLDDTFMDGDNGLFALNALDWISGNGDLIHLRSRGVTERPLEKLDSDSRAIWKAIWTFALPLLVALAAIARWRMRVRRGAMQ